MIINKIVLNLEYSLFILKILYIIKKIYIHKIILKILFKII